MSKDDLAIEEYVVLKSDAIGEKVVQELEILNHAWKVKLPPSVPEDLEPWKAKYCRYHNQCINQKIYDQSN